MKLLGFLFITSLAFICNLAQADDALGELMKKYSVQQTAETDVASTPVSIPAASPEETSAASEKTPKKVSPLPAKGKNAAHAAPESFNHTVQVASVPTEEEAKEKTESLVQQGHPAKYSEALVGGKKWYRITIGTFSSLQSAKDYIDTQLEGSLKTEAMVKKEASSPILNFAKTSSQTEPAPAAKSIEKKESPEDRQPASYTEKDIKTAVSQEEPTGLFGDWLGIKSNLKNSGVTPILKYKADFTQNSKGGTERRTHYLENFDVIADFDLEKLLGFKGTTLFLYGLGNAGGHPKEVIGDSFGTSSIEAPRAFKLYEGYIRKSFDDRFSGLIGLRDLNADFYATDSNAIFLNSAFGISPSFSQTGVNGPSIFPTTALAATVKYKSPGGFYFQSGVFNAQAGIPEKTEQTVITTRATEGQLYIWESGFAEGEDAARYKVGLGAWVYSKNKAPIDSSKLESQNTGSYLLIDKSITKDISIFLKYGRANAELNKFATSTEGGLVFKGLIPTRNEDKLGLGYARANASDDQMAINNSTPDESVLEVSYRVEVGHGIALTPDYQLITNPGLVKDSVSAEVGTLRLEIEF